MSDPLGEKSKTDITRLEDLGPVEHETSSFTVPSLPAEEPLEIESITKSFTNFSASFAPEFEEQGTSVTNAPLPMQEAMQEEEELTLEKQLEQPPITLFHVTIKELKRALDQEEVLLVAKELSLIKDDEQELLHLKQFKNDYFFLPHISQYKLYQFIFHVKHLNLQLSWEMNDPTTQGAPHKVILKESTHAHEFHLQWKDFSVEKPQNGKEFIELLQPLLFTKDQWNRLGEIPTIRQLAYFLSVPEFYSLKKMVELFENTTTEAHFSEITWKGLTFFQEISQNQYIILAKGIAHDSWRTL
jgi:hypothetical protein